MNTPHPLPIATGSAAAAKVRSEQHPRHRTGVEHLVLATWIAAALALAAQAQLLGADDPADPPSTVRAELGRAHQQLAMAQVQLARLDAEDEDPPEAPEPPEPPDIPDLSEALSGIQEIGQQFSHWGLGGETAPTLIAAEAPDDARRAEVEEDLAVMGRILLKACQRAAGSDSPPTALGIHIAFPFGDRQPRSMLLEGFGALFQLRVDLPLLPSPAREEVKTTTSEYSAWERTKREMYGPRRRSSGVVVGVDDARSDRRRAKYDPERVDALKKGLLEALKNATHIRNLKPDDQVVIAVQGSPAATVKRIEARSAGRRAEVVTTTTADSRPTILTIRVKKADTDDFAAGKLDLEEFSRRAKLAVY